MCAHIVPFDDGTWGPDLASMRVFLVPDTDAARALH